MKCSRGDFGGVGVVIGLRWIMSVESSRRVECVQEIFLGRPVMNDLVREIVRIILRSVNQGVESTAVVVGSFKGMHFVGRIVESINMNTSN